MGLEHESPDGYPEDPPPPRKPVNELIASGLYKKKRIREDVYYIGMAESMGVSFSGSKESSRGSGNFVYKRGLTHTFPMRTGEVWRLIDGNVVEQVLDAREIDRILKGKSR